LVRNKSDTLEQNWRELNYEDKWVENSRVLSLYEKKNYARNVFYRKVVEGVYGNVRSSRKEF